MEHRDVAERTDLVALVLERAEAVLGPETGLGRRIAFRRMARAAGSMPVRAHAGNWLSKARYEAAARGVEYVCLVADPLVFVGPGWTETPCCLLEGDAGIGAVGVMANEASSALQRAAPPFPYHTPSLLDEAVKEFKKGARLRCLDVDALDPFCVFLRRSDLEMLPEDTASEEVAEILRRKGKRIVLAADTYVHRYGPVYDQCREDLLALLPEGVEWVLDVGCARGGLGFELKRRRKVRVVGIEREESLARAARAAMDEVVVGDVETLAPGRFKERFDAVICGDLLEHLVDPFAVLEKLFVWLKPGGCLIVSVPNVGHWSILFDLAAGRWDYAPFTILSGTHLRFFTETSIREMLEEAGFCIREVEYVMPPLSSVGERFLGDLKESGIECDHRSLGTVEFRIRAEKENRGSG